jgi:hypothetical protein
MVRTAARAAGKAISKMPSAVTPSSVISSRNICTIIIHAWLTRTGLRSLVEDGAEGTVENLLAVAAHLQIMG